MKARVESLDASLDQLKDMFESITQLASSLGVPPMMGTAHEADKDPKGKDTDEAPPLVRLDPLLHLAPLVNLPSRLRDCLFSTENTKARRASADQLWGAWEPALRSVTVQS